MRIVIAIHIEVIKIALLVRNAVMLAVPVQYNNNIPHIATTTIVNNVFIISPSQRSSLTKSRTYVRNFLTPLCLSQATCIHIA